MLLHQLEPDDLRILGEVLDQSLRGLLNEIAHADDRQYRQGLQHRYERLATVRQQLLGTTATPGVLQAEKDDEIELDSSFH
jgi:hypothetical protein